MWSEERPAVRAFMKSEWKSRTRPTEVNLYYTTAEKAAKEEADEILQVDIIYKSFTWSIISCSNIHSGGSRTCTQITHALQPTVENSPTGCSESTMINVVRSKRWTPLIATWGTVDHTQLTRTYMVTEMYFYCIHCM